MNPSELRMMWMSQYNPDRISLEDAASYFSHPSVGLSIMDDMSHQTPMDINPMMSLVGGDFAAAAAVAASTAAVAALASQPSAALVSAAAAQNANDIYGLAQMGGLHQQLLQQQQQAAAAAAFQNYTECIDDDEAGGCMVDNIDKAQQYVSSEEHQQQQQVYDQLDDAGYGADGGLGGLASKQEIINIDDFVMLTDSNSYDGTDFMGSGDKDVAASAELSGAQEHELPIDDMAQQQQQLQQQQLKMVRGSHGGGTESGTKANANGNAPSGGHRTQRKTRKIEPVNRPGLVLKTPIAYKGNIDPSVIPIMKDGMAVCERCGAIGVKHTFYTKTRRFCSMSCARGELYSMVAKQSSSGNQNNQQHSTGTAAVTAAVVVADDDGSGETHLSPPSQQCAADVEQAASIKTSNYRFRITDQSKITQINGFGEPIVTADNATDTASNDDNDRKHHLHSYNNNNNNDATSNGDCSRSDDDGDRTNSLAEPPEPKALRLYRDVLPVDELPQIPKYERLPAPCPQMEKIISVRRRHRDPSHSYDWTQRLAQPEFIAAAVTSFPHAPGYEVWDNIGLDMKVEVENTDCDAQEVIQPGQTPYSFWVATVLKIQGYKALMRYVGFDEPSHDFWVNLCNAEVHSVGWCATRGKPLIPPRSIANKYTDWKDLLVEQLSGAQTLPSNFYNKINDSMQSRFRLGLNLECVDKNRISQVRLATVTRIVGKRLFLRYFDSDDGFWCHEDSPIIHPVGWATTVGHNLAAPQDYLERMLAGRETMIEVHEDDATIELFKMNFTFEEYYVGGKTNNFIEGMKLEAVDPLNLSAICAATVMAVLKFGYMMIRIDSYQPDASGSDWFCYHEKSPSIFPVGFCATHDITLTPPNSYDVPTFRWDAYLRETGSIAASQDLFHRLVPDHGFKVGMSLECADLMDPRLVCVAMVSRVVGRLLKVHFDGWTDEYDQWLDCESPDFYPVGWCVLVNHKLEGPPQPVAQQPQKATPKSKNQRKRKKKAPTIAATTKVCSDNISAVKPRTIALKTNPDLPKLSIKLELKPEHHNAAFYEDNNDAMDDGEEENEEYEDSISHCSDQSLAPQSQLLATDKHAAAATPTRAHPLPSQVTAAAASVKKSVSPAPPSVGRKANSYIGNSAVSNSKYIPRLTDSNDTSAAATAAAAAAAVSTLASATEAQHAELMPETWNVYDVSQFLRVNDCTAHCDTFSRNKIDGKRLLQLSKDEIINLLGMKVGPALKIYDLIQQLKCKVNPGRARLHKPNKSYL